MTALFTESDHDRLVRRISAVTAGDLTHKQIEKLVSGDVDLLKDLPNSSKQKVAALFAPSRRGELEKIVGCAIDYVPIAFLELARRSAAAVGRVIDEGRRPWGSGVMVSPRLFMTNHHVLTDPDKAARCAVQFNFQLGIDDVPEVVTEFRFDPATFFWTSPEDDLDVALVAVGPRTAGDQQLEHFGWTALSSAGDKHAEGDFVTVIEHPQGDFKQIALRENRVIGRGKNGVTLYYAADTLPGSSGSPVFNDEFALVALHHAGGPRNDTVLEDGRAVPDDCNEGIRISTIVEALRQRHDTFGPRLRDLLAEALNPPASAKPLEKAVPVSAPGQNSAVVGAEASVPTLVTADLHLPRLLIAESGGDLAPTAPVAAPAAPAPTAAAPTIVGGPTVQHNDAPQSNYQNRAGYEPEFLTLPVAPPTVSTSLLKLCAVPTGSSRTTENVLLKYHHFSLVVRADRRMPLFTIVNLDGGRARSINRKTGEVEAAETWYVDSRIATNEQLDQDVFASQRPRLFDRGHMVRRLDPAWGSPAAAKQAADDTFHFTNCCPQMCAFNQHLWQGIENYALVNASTEKKRITVITGPVFGDSDPKYRSVAVPRAFWKIVVRVSGGRLRATGFVADQNAALDAAFAAGDVEAFTDVSKVAAYQLSIVDIEARSGLSFNGLREFDTLKVGLESNAPLDRLADASW